MKVFSFPFIDFSPLLARDFIYVQQAEECPVLVQQLLVFQLEVISTNDLLKLIIQLA
jgi:hypothetical protein